MDDDARCPCGSGETYGACCGRMHRGEAAAATAEQLMRSRYSAFGVGDAGYLLRTWHSSTRPPDDVLDAAVTWRHLEVIGRVAGGFLDAEGTVTFRAHARRDGRREVVGETSRFVREDGRWVYLGPV